jgi:SPP1 family predicted phage head-tail adaptor
MRVGTRRRFITIEMPVEVKQANASVKTTWAVFKKVWASIETLKSFERTAVSATWPMADCKIGMRYIEGLSNTMRIVYNDQIYAIYGIDNVDMRNRELFLTCQTGAKAH